MKSHISKTILILTSLCLLLISTNQTSAQTNKDHISYQHIISKLTFTSRISKSTEQINEELIKEIQERKVDFILTSEDEVELKKAGASDLLIKMIDKNVSDEAKKKLEQTLYSTVVGHSNNPERTIKLGKQYLRVFEDSPEHKAQVDYWKKGITKLEKRIAEYKQIKEKEKIYNEFDQAYKDKKWNELFEIGAEILKDESDFVDISIILASVGYDKIAKKNPKSENLVKAVNHAEKAIDLLEAGTKSKTEKYGAYDYEYKTEEFPDGKANALGWMNYIIGYIKYNYLNEKEAAIPYFQKSLQYKSEVKKFAETLPILEK